MSAPLDQAGPLDDVENPGPPLLVVRVGVDVPLDTVEDTGLPLLVIRVEVEVCPPELLGPFEEATR